MFKKYILKSLTYIFLFSFGYSQAHSESQNVLQILESLQQDIKTLERAVYSGSVEITNETGSSSILNDNSEDVLTKHLLL